MGRRQSIEKSTALRMFQLLMLLILPLSPVVIVVILFISHLVQPFGLDNHKSQIIIFSGLKDILFDYAYCRVLNDVLCDPLFQNVYLNMLVL